MDKKQLDALVVFCTISARRLRRTRNSDVRWEHRESCSKDSCEHSECTQHARYATHETSPVAQDEGMLAMPDLAKFGRSEQLHVAFCAVQQFREKKGALPSARTRRARELGGSETYTGVVGRAPH